MRFSIRVLFVFVLLTAYSADACLWDSDTLAEEKRKRPELAELIMGEPKKVVDTAKLEQRIAALNSSPKPNGPAWINELGGALIRLSRLDEAVKILEPAAKQFPDDYGVHANLGTAYHLLGRYVEAEKEISRGLEINPNAHFGLEKYHLALLQYLIRDQEYQGRHVFVDEWSLPFLSSSKPYLYPPQSGLPTEEPAMLTETNHQMPVDLPDAAALDKVPDYRKRWNLAHDRNFASGVIYMASLNPRQPAAWTMVGILCQASNNLNLAVKAFEKAIALGTPQASLLATKVTDLNEYIRKADRIHRGPPGFWMIPASVVAILVCGTWWFWRWLRRKERLTSPASPPDLRSGAG